MSAQAISVGNVAYWGSWDGILHATVVSGSGAGTNLWTQNLGQTTSAPAAVPAPRPWPARRPSA